MKECSIGSNARVEERSSGVWRKVESGGVKEVDVEEGDFRRRAWSREMEESWEEIGVPVIVRCVDTKGMRMEDFTFVTHHFFKEEDECLLHV